MGILAQGGLVASMYYEVNHARASLVMKNYPGKPTLRFVYWLAAC